MFLHSNVEKKWFYWNAKICSMVMMHTAGWGSSSCLRDRPVKPSGSKHFCCTRNSPIKRSTSKLQLYDRLTYWTQYWRWWCRTVNYISRTIWTLYMWCVWEGREVPWQQGKPCKASKNITQYRIWYNEFIQQHNITPNNSIINPKDWNHLQLNVFCMLHFDT